MKSRSVAQQIHWAALCLLAGAVVSVGSAHAAAPDPAWFEQQLQGLGSASLEEREKALTNLRAESSITLSVIEASLADPKLGAEQRQRLAQEAVRLFASSPRAAMGVQFDWMDEGGEGVRIAGVVRGFDSEKVLLPGDLLVSMDGQTIQNRDHMRAMIVSHDPGATVQLQVFRNDEPLNITLKMGNFGNLGRGGATLDQPVLRAAWDLRCKREATHIAEAEPMGVSKARWTVIEEGLAERQQRVQAGAGEPQGIVNEAGAFFVQQNNNPIPGPVGGISATGAARRFTNEPPFDFNLSGQSTVNDETQRQIEQYRAIIRACEMRLRDPNVPKAQRDQLQAQADYFRREIQRMRRDKQGLLNQPEVKLLKP